jgi:hypothetical protein
LDMLEVVKGGNFSPPLMPHPKDAVAHVVADHTLVGVAAAMVAATVVVVVAPTTTKSSKGAHTKFPV